MEKQNGDREKRDMRLIQQAFYSDHFWGRGHRDKLAWNMLYEAFKAGDDQAVHTVELLVMMELSYKFNSTFWTEFEDCHATASWWAEEEGTLSQPKARRKSRQKLKAVEGGMLRARQPIKDMKATTRLQRCIWDITGFLFDQVQRGKYSLNPKPKQSKKPPKEGPRRRPRTAPGNFKAWVQTCAQRKCMDYFRADMKDKKRFDRAYDIDDSLHAAMWYSRDNHTDVELVINEEIDQLPDEIKEAFLRRLYEQPANPKLKKYTWAMQSLDTGMSQDRARYLYRKAKRLLRPRLRARLGEPLINTLLFEYSTTISSVAVEHSGNDQGDFTSWVDSMAGRMRDGHKY